VETTSGSKGGAQHTGSGIQERHAGGHTCGEISPAAAGRPKTRIHASATVRSAMLTRAHAPSTVGTIVLLQATAAPSARQ
jgi:hypothetical protein